MFWTNGCTDPLQMLYYTLNNYDALTNKTSSH